MSFVEVRAHAKVNLTLEVLNKRPDGFHNLRSIFQTISLTDTLGIEYTRARKTEVRINSVIPDNLVVRAAEAVLQELKLSAHLRFTLIKRIPMGGGLGGGSSDAAAVLRTLPGLTGKRIALERLIEIGAGLGSDVPFFLFGGCALGFGRGTELYPLPHPKPKPLLLVTPGIHSSTPEAYKLLQRTEALPGGPNRSQALTAALAAFDSEWWRHCSNDFEAPVFSQYPELKKVRDRLRRTGALAAMMSGSGSSVFGLYETRADRDRAKAAIPESHAVEFVKSYGAK